MKVGCGEALLRCDCSWKVVLEGPEVGWDVLKGFEWVDWSGANGSLGEKMGLGGPAVNGSG